MIKIGVIGGAGYTAGELLRVLVYHPQAEIVFVNSSSSAGKPLHSIHSGLEGVCDLTFTDQLELDKIDLLICCSAHGDTKKFIDNTELPEGLKIVDLSTDYRAKGDHNFIYGLPELQREEIKKAERIANPGCFATAIQLGLLPLANAGLLNNDIHVNAITGSTGAGQKPTESTHFSWRNNNISIYKPFTHQHLGEITQSLTQLQDSFSVPINFIPVRGNFTRGIFATIYTKYDGTIEEAINMYKAYYAEHPFVTITDKNPDLKQVVGTNRCLIHLEKHNGQLLILSSIDNLLKGASGQAVQNMNLMFGLEENCGLNLKPIGF